MNIMFITWLMIRLLVADQNDSACVVDALVEFRIKNAGVEVAGIIEGVRVDINFNKENLTESAVIAVAQATNIRTGISIRDKHLRKSDYFDAARYPEIVLTSTSFRKVARQKFLGTFLVQIKQFKREITVPFTISEHGNSQTYSGRFEINRLDFGLGEESLILDNTVRIFVSARVEARNR